MPQLKVNNLTINTLQEINLSVDPGNILCLSGPSGSGKSRLLKAAADLEPHDGKIFLGDKSQNDMPGHEWRRQVMLVPAQSAWWYETVGEHFFQPMPKALESLGFPAEAESWQIDRISSGEKQRLALIRALSYTPNALLLDEPTANLDAQSTRTVETWLLNIIQNSQLPVIWVAHSQEQIRRVANKHFAINDNYLVEQEILQ